MTTDPRIICKTCGDWGEVAVPTGPMDVELRGMCPEPGCAARDALERGAQSAALAQTVTLTVEPTAAAFYDYDEFGNAVCGDTGCPGYFDCPTCRQLRYNDWMQSGV